MYKKFITDKRIGSELTQQNLADTINIKRSSIAAFESGARIPTVLQFQQINEKLDISDGIIRTILVEAIIKIIYKLPAYELLKIYHQLNKS